MLEPQNNYIATTYLTIEPNWEALLEHIAKLHSSTAEELLEQARQAENGEGDGIWGETFSFQIEKHSWFDHYRVWDRENIQIIEPARRNIFHIFKPAFNGISPWKSDEAASLLFERLKITPSLFGFDDRHWSPLKFERKLAEIPYWQIMEFLTDFAFRSEYGPMWAVKKFPDELQQVLTENAITYEWWYSHHDGVDLHHLESKNSEDMAKMGTVDATDAKHPRHRAWVAQAGVELYNSAVTCHSFNTRFCRFTIRLQVAVAGG